MLPPRLSRGARRLRWLLAPLLMSQWACEPVRPSQEPPDPPRSSTTHRAPERSGKLLQADDIFGPKSLAGRPPGKPKWSEDGTTLYFLRPSKADARVMDLWRMDPSSGKSTLLVAASSLREGHVTLTEAQKAARERRRVRSLGISTFLPDKAGRGVLLPVGGILYWHDLRTGDTRRLLEKPGGELDPKPAPDGKSIAFVRKGDLWVIDLATGRQRRLTSTATATLKNGVAEFVAQEELDRFTGYWWAPDSSAIAYAEVDESRVTIVRRPEIGATGTKIIRQRYPSAGTSNASVRLGVLDLTSGSTTWLALGKQAPGRPEDRYLARVSWVRPARSGPLRLAVQLLSRDQRALTLWLCDPKTGQSRAVLVDRDPQYVNLHRDLRSMEDRSAFLWSSEASGLRQVSLHDWNGKRLATLTRKPLFVDEIVGLDKKRGALFATVPTNRGRELHLYRFSLDGSSPPRRISVRPGWHQVTFNRSATYFVDRFSAISTPPQVRLHRADGTLVQVIDPNEARRYHSFALASSRFVDIPASDGVVLNGLMLSPPLPISRDPERRAPAIIYTYGGPHGQVAANRWHRTEPWHQLLAQRGFVVLLVDGRGTAHRGKAFEAKLHMQLGRVDVADVVAAARWLGARPGIDRHRLGLWGWSYGGYLTVMTLLQSGKLFRAGVAVAPVTDWTLYDTAYTERYLGHPATPAGKRAYARSNPVHLARNLRTNLLLIHGMADDNVLLGHTLLLAQALQKNLRPFQMMLYPGKKHSLKGSSTRKHLLGGILGFFQLHLQGPPR